MIIKHKGDKNRQNNTASQRKTGRTTHRSQVFGSPVGNRFLYLTYHDGQRLRPHGVPVEGSANSGPIINTLRQVFFDLRQQLTRAEGLRYEVITSGRSRLTSRN